jgi:hypothetical protein
VTRNRWIVVGVCAAILVGLGSLALTVGGSDDDPALGDPIQLSYGFAVDDEGWSAGFADLPANEEDVFELDSGWRELPDGLDGGGFLLTGSNRSGDLHMFMTRKVEGLRPNMVYTGRWTVELASNVPSGMVGIGGSPTGSIFLKAGIVTAEPAVVDVDGTLRLTADVGSQSDGGADAAVIGTLENPNVDAGAGDPAPFAVVPVDGAGSPIKATTDADGSLWLFFGIDSGFEGVTTVYVTDVVIDLDPAV